jgi:hypothetical protein
LLSLFTSNREANSITLTSAFSLLQFYLSTPFSGTRAADSPARTHALSMAFNYAIRAIASAAARRF